MSGDNGKEEIKIPTQSVKSEAQLAQERLERYQANPDSFTENNELVVGVKKVDGGLSYLLGGSIRDLEICFCRLNQKILNILNQADVELMKQSKIIHPAGHGIMDFAKRFKR